MKKGQILEGTVTSVAFPNNGMVQTEEGTVWVKDTIPGQKVRFSVTKKSGGRVRGRLLQILQHSDLEKRASVCGIFPDCGGCSWQTMEYADQLALKESQVADLLSPVLGGDSCWAQLYEGIRPSPQEFAYRNKMEFSFGDEYKDGPLSLGLHKRGSRYDVLTASNCRLVHPDMTKILDQTLAFFREAEVPYYHKRTREGVLRHLLLRRAESTGEILVCLVTAADARGESRAGFPILLQQYRDALLGLHLEGRIKGILHMENHSLADVVRSDQTTVLYGQDFFYEELLGLRFQITPFSFFQTNSLGAEVLYRTARDFVGEEKADVLFDLYSGTGTIAQILSPVAKKVIGVELVEEAVRAARENARQNGLDNCSFIAGDVLQVLDTIPGQPDLIVLDPPREGIHPKALPKLIACGAPRILYISCKPSSLARDLSCLLAGGYRPVRICLVDLFPQTANVETVVLLSKRNAERSQWEEKADRPGPDTAKTGEKTTELLH